jgi:hypothetical protein
MLSHPPSDMSYDLMAILKLYPELSSGQGFHHCSGQFNDFFIFGHKYNELSVPKSKGVVKGL